VLVGWSGLNEPKIVLTTVAERAGAYDTIRCDLQLDKSEDGWRIWGQDFHLRRLQESFRSIAPNRSPESTQKALKLSEEMVQALLQQAENSEILQTARPQADCDAHIQLVRLGNTVAITV
jgi:hypothetical protein